MKLSALAVLLFISCAASQSSQPTGPWSIVVETSGGFAGRGAGNYSISSDGRVAVTSMDGKSCTFEATTAERERFATLVANARPDTWSASYAPEDRCCDRFEYTLTFERDGMQRKTEWIDNPLPMPRDLAAIVEAMVGGPGSLRVEHGDRCK